MSCVGSVIPPGGGKKLYFATGLTVELEWKYGDDVEEVQTRAWNFESSTLPDEQLAIIQGNNNPTIYNNILTGVTIKDPATLVLNNVNQSFSGTYEFRLTARKGSDNSKVEVVITGMF